MWKVACVLLAAAPMLSQAQNQPTETSSSVKPAVRLFSGPRDFKTWSIGINGGLMAPVVPTGGSNDFTKWKAFNKCEKKTDTSDLKIDLDRKVDGAETKVVRYESKEGKIVTELWEVVDGGHVTPPRSAARERIIKWMLARSK